LGRHRPRLSGAGPARRSLSSWFGVRRRGLLPAQPGKQFLVGPEQQLIPLASASGILAHQLGAQQRRGDILAVVTWHVGHDGSGDGAPARPLLTKGKLACSA
jgi:hypothetical protein